MNRYPLRDLIAATGYGPDQLRRLMGCGGGELNRYLTHGVSFCVAERWAERCGLHPYSVWPEMAIDVLEGSRDCLECGERFFPVNARKRFCCEACKSLHHRDRWRGRSRAPYLREWRARRKDAA